MYVIFTFGVSVFKIFNMSLTIDSLSDVSDVISALLEFVDYEDDLDSLYSVMDESLFFVEYVFSKIYKK